eukprot:9353176-Lingulodinium_polyedra.AAC.1
MQSAITAWWKRWRGRARPTDSILSELRAAAAADCIHTPSPALARWLEDYGAQPGGTHPDDAAGWMA